MKRIIVSGTNIVISNGKVIVNGKEIELDKDEKHFTLEIHTSVGELTVDNAERITVEGSVNHLKTTNGDVHCHDVQGNVSTVNGDVTANNIKGDVSTVNGDIN